MRRPTNGTLLRRITSATVVLLALPVAVGSASAARFGDTRPAVPVTPAAVVAPTTTTTRLCDSSSVTIPNTAGGAASVYPLAVTASGVAGLLTAVTVEVNGFSHDFPDDVDIALTGPNGTSLVVLSDVGGSSAVSNLDLVLDGAASSVLPNVSSLTSGTFRPTDVEPGDAFPTPGPQSPSSASTVTLDTAFAGIDPNGTWSLWIVNDSRGFPGGGSLARGFCVNLTTDASVSTTTSLNASSPVSLLDESVTFTASVAAAGVPVSGGSVSFLDGATVIGANVPVNASGVASLTTSSLPQGARLVTARYSGVAATYGPSSASIAHQVDAVTTNPSAGRFCNSSSVTIPNTAGGAASVYPLRLTVGGMAGTLAAVTVELNGFSHLSPDDVDVALTGPNGTSLVVLSDVGGVTAVSNATLVVDGAASSSLPNTTAIASGTFRPTDFETGDAFPAPGPASPSSASAVTLATAFNGIDPNGAWSLWIVNDSAGQTGGGSLARGFCVNVTTNPPALTISKTHVGNVVRGQVGATYSVVVGNNGPGATAGTVSVVDAPPAGMTVTGLGGTGWTCTTASLTCSRTDSLAAGSSYPPITVTVDIAGNASSPLVNSVIVSGGGASSAQTTDSTVVVDPATAPGAPTGVTATNVRAGTVSVAFGPPASDGGATVSSYRAVCTPVITGTGTARSASGPSSPLAVSGLTGGVRYQCRVNATNRVGTGPGSAPSATVVPLGVPGSPTGAAATSTGSGALTVTFTAPTSDGGAPITSYRTVCSSNDGGTARSASGASSPLVVAALTGGATYTCAVVAVSVGGSSTPSSPSAPVTVRSVPGPPTGLVATRLGPTRASVSFTAPASDGGAAITSFRVVCTSTSGGSASSSTGTASPIVLTSLVSGADYTCRASATNAVGTSRASTAVPITSPAV